MKMLRPATRPMLLVLLLSSFTTACTREAEADTAVPKPPMAPAVETTATIDVMPKDDGLTRIAAADVPRREPDVVYVPTPQPVVEAMLELAEVKPGDVLYDLGSGDGRIPITAAKKYGIRATGIDINPVRIREANRNAEEAGVTGLVEFREEDLFTSDFSDASVVTLYLLPSLNAKLRPRLLDELRPGTRIVSHAFRMGGWEPEVVRQVGENTIYLWRVPERQ